MSAPPPSPGRPSRRAWLAGGGLAAVAAGLGAWVGWRRLEPVAAADDAVTLLLSQSLPDAAGQPLALARFTGRPLVVNFWATWCPPCVEEMPELSALHAELAPKGLGMIGIGIDSAAKIADFSAKNPVSYPLVVAGMGGSELARRFGNPSGALPFTVLVNREGQIAHRLLGRVDIGRLKSMADALTG
ncbi:MAG: TlpA family protein disulfide reductase [Burkholderiales bacterium]|nr:MAG: TlpA family protein disulfide reductase [Burkholderiales bacterium]